MLRLPLHDRMLRRRFNVYRLIFQLFVTSGTVAPRCAPRSDNSKANYIDISSFYRVAYIGCKQLNKCWNVCMYPLPNYCSLTVLDNHTPAIRSVAPWESQTDELQID
jgi:hypothetical protein